MENFISKTFLENIKTESLNESVKMFSDVKKIVKETIVTPFDHATIFNKNTPHLRLAEDLKSNGHKVVLVNYQPTSEMLVIDFAKRIKKKLDINVEIYGFDLGNGLTKPKDYKDLQYWFDEGFYKMDQEKLKKLSVCNCLDQKAVL